jgi:copper homeostasis protein
MQNGFVLEICVESVDRAVAAQRGGAHRIELCADLPSGGITPSAGMMRVARANLRIPIYVLIRPRAGDFFYTDREFEIMESDIGSAKQLGMDGVVLGLLDEKRQVDIERTARLVKLAHPLPVTFHRAFDLCQDLPSSLEQVIGTGAARILTSGGEDRATEGLAPLAKLVTAAAGRIVVMPGGGIALDDVSRVLRRTAAREIHTSLRLALASSNPRSKNKKPVHTMESKQVSEFEQRVRKVIDLFATFPEPASAPKPYSSGCKQIRLLE